MTRVAKKIHFPTTRLAELVARPGGITPSTALEEAMKSVQSMLDVGLETTSAAMAAIEKIAYSAKNGRLEPNDMQGILRQADHIVTMAATFGFAGLEEASKSLCDVTDGLLSRGMPDAAPIIVHVQSMRLMIPGGIELGAEEIERILTELAKVRLHYEFARLSAGVPAETDPPEIAG
ncbi:MAG: hypothetical protein ABSC92_18565 [Rhizomicrobium sp.]|jgi:hypothetical protein